MKTSKKIDEDLKKIVERTKEAAKETGRDVGEDGDSDFRFVWNVAGGLSVFAAAARLEDGVYKWDFVATVGTEIVMKGKIFGGKNRVATYLRYIRKGIVKRATRRRKGGTRFIASGPDAADAVNFVPPVTEEDALPMLCDI